VSLEDSLQQRNEKLNNQSFFGKRLKNLVTFDDNQYYNFYGTSTLMMNHSTIYVMEANRRKAFQRIGNSENKISERI
jgi:hypothetical protein